MKNVTTKTLALMIAMVFHLKTTKTKTKSCKVGIYVNIILVNSKEIYYFNHLIASIIFKPNQLINVQLYFLTRTSYLCSLVSIRFNKRFRE